MASRTIRIVLVKPKEDKNIGAVCRAMKTMGFGNLYIVGHENIDRGAAAATAVHAMDVLDRAVHCGTLEEAIRDSVLSAGISRRRGKWRKYFSLTPEQLAERIAAIRDGTCAIVFGNEASGLNAEDMTQCNLRVRIPSSPEFPSLNLSHAAQIITYQLFRRLGESAGTGLFDPIPRKQLDHLISLVIAYLSNIGFFTQGDRREMYVFLEDILARAALSEGEADRLAGIFRKISGLIARSGIEGSESKLDL